MRAYISVLFLACAPTLAATEPLPTDEMIRLAEDTNLDDFIWKNRPLIIFADSENDPRYTQQIEYIESGLNDLSIRDVVVITDTNKTAPSDIRKELRPRGFMLVLMAKDGTIHLRKPVPWDVREITRSIDKLPLRQQEVRDRRGQD